jgi:NAD/NADP transhydrogenase beta subunit
MAKQQNQIRPLRQLDSLAKLMDSQFKVPGTEMRFGLDAIIGLIPGVGDMTTFAISGYMLWIMAQNGASGFVLARMILNVLIDTIVGSIPFAGDIFDFAFKSNTRNMRLMHEHYQHGRHQGSAWKVIIPVLLILLLLMAGIVWLAYQLFSWLYALVF